jgi:hypothetical protein
VGATGTAVVDFGALPGNSDATIAVTGQAAIGAGSSVEAWVVPTANVDHNADEHIVEGLRIYAGNIVPGTGFTIYAVHDHGQTVNGTDHFAWGDFSLAWAWV